MSILIADAQLGQRLRIAYLPVGDGRAAQLSTIGASTERLADVDCEAADVGAAADMRANMHLWIRVINELETMDRDGAQRNLHFSTITSEFVGTHTVDFERAKYRRTLLNGARELPQRGFDFLASWYLLRNIRHFALGVTCRTLLAEPKCCLVHLVVLHVRAGVFALFANTKYQQTSRKRIERAAVTHFDARTLMRDNRWFSLIAPGAE